MTVLKTSFSGRKLRGLCFSMRGLVLLALSVAWLCAVSTELGQAMGKPAEATGAFRRVIEISADDASAHYNLGVVLQEQEHYDEGVAAYRRAIELKPDYAEAHNNLGSSLARMGQVDEAVSAFRRALEIRPDLEPARNNLANWDKNTPQPA